MSAGNWFVEHGLSALEWMRLALVLVMLAAVAGWLRDVLRQRRALRRRRVNLIHMPPNCPPGLGVWHWNAATREWVKDF